MEYLSYTHYLYIPIVYSYLLPLSRLAFSPETAVRIAMGRWSSARTTCRREYLSERMERIVTVDSFYPAMPVDPFSRGSLRPKRGIPSAIAPEAGTDGQATAINGCAGIHRIQPFSALRWIHHRLGVLQDVVLQGGPFHPQTDGSSFVAAYDDGPPGAITVRPGVSANRCRRRRQDPSSMAKRT